jgi:hypothetical protein
MKQMFTRLACAVAILAPMHAWAEEIGFGKDIPLELAVRQIVPGDVKVTIEDGVDTKAKVSWGDETSWKKAVSGAASSAGYVVAITDDSVKVMSKGAVVESKPVVVAGAVSTPSSSSKPSVRNRPAKPRPAKTQRSAPRRERTETRRTETRTETVSGGGFVFVPEESKAPPAPRVRTASVDAKGDAGAWREYKDKPAPAASGKWVAGTGEDLHALLSQWSEKEGWRLVWESDYRYSLNSSAQFEGDYIAAVTQLLASMKDVRPVVTAHFFKGNRTLVVGNNSLDSVN